MMRGSELSDLWLSFSWTFDYCWMGVFFEEKMMAKELSERAKHVRLIFTYTLDKRYSLSFSL
jgi:hypothetical protein